MSNYFLRCTSDVSPDSPLQEPPTDLQIPDESDSDLWYLTCSICNLQFSSLLNFRIHTQGHLPEKPYECSRCHRHYQSKFELKDHNCSTGEIPFTCEVCSVAFSTKQKFLEHLRIHYKPKTFKCSKCGEELFAFGKPKPHCCNLREDSSVSKAGFKCGACEKQFFSKLNYSIHQRVHADEPVMNCHDCRSQIPLGYWKDHACLPFKIRNVCSICFTDCITKTNLMHHKLSHKKKRGDYCCYVCNKRYFRKANLLFHSQRHKRKETYRCFYCKKCFLYKKIFSNHCCRLARLARKHSQSPIVQSMISHICSRPARKQSSSQSARNLKLIQSFPIVQAQISSLPVPNQNSSPPLQSQSPSPPVQNQSSSPLDRNKNIPLLVRLPQSMICSPLQNQNGSLTQNLKSIRKILSKAKMASLTQIQSSSPSAQGQNVTVLVPFELYKKAYKAKKAYCQRCDRSFHSKYILKKHLAWHDRPRPFSCSSCDTRFFSVDGLLNHYKTHSELTFICQFCSKAFSKTEDFNEHLLAFHAGSDKYRCYICEQFFHTKKELRIHYSVHTGKPVYTCRHCKKQFTTKYVFDNHEGLHNNERELTRCSKCYRVFKNMDAFKLHQEKGFHKCEFCPLTYCLASGLKNHVKFFHSEIKPYKCTFCPRAFTQQSKLVLHLQQHASIKPFSCNICEKKFNNKISLKNHTLTHYVDQKRHVCDVCQKRFPTRTKLKDHYRSHSGERPYMCELCGKMFTQARNLCMHKKLHLEAKPFKCDICGKEFVFKQLLKQHQYTHTGERPFKCKLCNKDFKYLTSLRNHQYSHGFEKPFKCQVCGKRFIYKCTLDKHMHVHRSPNAKKSFRCEKCQKNFTRPSFLRRHIQMHKEEN